MHRTLISHDGFKRLFPDDGHDKENALSNVGSVKSLLDSNQREDLLTFFFVLVLISRNISPT